MEWVVEGHTATCVNNEVIVDVSHTLMHLVIAMNRCFNAQQGKVVSDLLADKTFMQYMNEDNAGIDFSFVDVMYALASLNYPSVNDNQAREIASRLNNQER